MATMNRAERAKEREKVQEALRFGEDAIQQKVEQDYSEMMNSRKWPERPAWHLKNTQGLNITIAEPEPVRDVCVNIVLRNKTKYAVDVGQGRDTVFDSRNLKLTIKSSTVSNDHCKLHFTREKDGHSVIKLEDTNSLNGTFVLARPPAESTFRPMLEREVRGDLFDLKGVEYIRCGPITIIALEGTNIFWEDQDEDEVDEPEVEPTHDMVPDLLAQGWYFPRIPNYDHHQA